MVAQLPLSHETSERVVHSAARLADLCRAEASDEARKDLGQYFTSASIAAFMAELVEIPRRRDPVRVLDPGAGTGILGIAVAERLVERHRSVHLVAVEIDPRAAVHLEQTLCLARARLGERFSFEILRSDFLDLATPTLGVAPIAPFDIAIGNPPYFKMSPSDARGGDAPNIYARFMEVAARLLVRGGQMCFIVPRSFASGLYFKRFRHRFHGSMRLDRAHVFESRRAAFEVDGVLQENLILCYQKAAEDHGAVILSSSAGIGDLAGRAEHAIPRALILPPSDPNAALFLPLDARDLRIMDLFRSFRHVLGHEGLDVSTGPVVPFRATHELVREPRRVATVPMLWMQHVRPEGVTWPLGAAFRKPEHIRASASPKLLVPNSTYVLMRRFSAKEEARRLVAAVLHAGQLPGDSIGLENHLNFIHRPGGRLERDEAIGLGVLLSSALFDAYFRISSGNTQVSATELRALPLPAPEVLRRIARRREDLPRDATDALVEEVLGAS